MEELEKLREQLADEQRARNRADIELDRLSRSMRDFTAVASHDLRTPLTSILGASRTLMHAQSMSPEQNAELVAIIERQARHLSRMVDDLLTVSRIEAGEMEPQTQTVALRVAFDRVVGNLGQRASDIAVSHADLAVVADPDHFERMLVNYVTNAMRYGEPPIVIDARDGDGFVEIRVCDHGKGVPEEFTSRLFGKFARGDAARTQGGTGLGLSIVQGLARANGGDTWYEPNQPEGSCFAFKLPRAS